VKVSLRRLPIALLLALCAVPVPGQQAAATYCAVFPIQDLSPGTDAEDYRQTITDAVVAAAQAHGFTLIPEAAWRDVALAHSIDPARILDGGQALAVARLVGAEVAVTGCYSLKDEEIYYSIQCWNATDGSLASGVQETAPFNLAFFSGLSLALGDELFPVAQKGQVPVPRVSFTSPDEGMEVLLSGDTSIGVITDGRISWPIGPVEQGTKVVVEKRKKGYHTDTQTVTLQTDTDIALAPLAREHTGSLQVETTVGQLLGLGLTLKGYAAPDWVFAYMSAHAWAQPPATFTPRAVVHADLGTGLGGYVWFPPDSRFRAGLVSGVGCIVTQPTSAGFPFWTDLYLNVVNLFVEMDVKDTVLFLRTEFRYALGLGANLLGEEWMQDGAPVTTLGVSIR
jgi:hypothetical protein